MKVLGYGLVFFDSEENLWIGVYDKQGDIGEWQAIHDHDLELMTDIGLVTLDYDEDNPEMEWTEFTLHVSLSSDSGIKAHEIINSIERYDPGPRKLSYQEIYSKALTHLEISARPKGMMH